MQLMRLYFKNYIKEEKSGLISEWDEREKVYAKIFQVRKVKKWYLKSFQLKKKLNSKILCTLALSESSSF